MEERAVAAEKKVSDLASVKNRLAVTEKNLAISIKAMKDYQDMHAEVGVSLRAQSSSPQKASLISPTKALSPEELRKRADSVGESTSKLKVLPVRFCIILVTSFSCLSLYVLPSFETDMTNRISLKK